MTDFSITIPPGVVLSDSDYAATGRWIDMDKVRFVAKMPEKLSGTRKLVETSFTGKTRGAYAYGSFSGNSYMLFGTAAKLQLLRNGIITSITPYRVSGVALTNPFTTASGSSVVNVNHTNHGISSSGVNITISGGSAVGGITLAGDYLVTSIVDASNYTITHSSNASSNATGGGSVTVSYEINPGTTDPTYIVGWGVGGWGVGGWGVPIPISQAPISEPMNWSFGSYGEDVVVNPLNDTLYYFQSSTGARPTKMTNAPANVRFNFVTAERYIIALGCTTVAGTFDAMTVRWPDILDNTIWTPASTNTANQRKLQGGTRLIAGSMLTDGVSLVWSDYGVFVFQFTGSANVYDSRLLATECGIVGPHAFSITNGIGFWMSNGTIWMYSGYVQQIPNLDDVNDFIFKDINQQNISKSFSFYNPLYNEVWFVFPKGASVEPSHYAMVNLDDFSWATGTWSRTAEARYKVGTNSPILFGTDGYIYQHDVLDSTDNDGNAMEAYIELSPTDIEAGNRLVDIWGFIPDFKRQTGNLSVRLYSLDRPRDTEMMVDDLTVAPTDKLVGARLSGRQFGMKITSNTLGGDFRLGKIGLDISPAGSKR